MKEQFLGNETRVERGETPEINGQEDREASRKMTNRKAKRPGEKSTEV